MCFVIKIDEIKPTDGFVKIKDGEFVTGSDSEYNKFIPWGLNYDRTILNGQDVLLEDVLKSNPEKIDKDFRAMKEMNGNVVRIFLSITEILENSDKINKRGLKNLSRVLDAARKNHIKVLLTGLSLIRPASAPLWLVNTDDETLEKAEMLYWKTIARHCRNNPEIFAYDLQNKPVIHWNDNEALTEGCFDMSGNQKFCYVHKHYRKVSKKWTEYIHEKYQSEENLKNHWKDYPRENENWSLILIPNPFESEFPPFTRGDKGGYSRYSEYISFQGELISSWAEKLAVVIRQEDPNHLITVGALSPDAMAEPVDFYCLHLYPHPVGEGEDFIGSNKQSWQEQIDRVPKGKPLVIEEFYPMWAPYGVPLEEVFKTLMDVSENRAKGWFSFYWGKPESLNWQFPEQRYQYESWLKIWSQRFVQ